MDLSRNWLFISNKEQEILKNKKILFAGVGLGSYLATSLVRIGFNNLIIADGDNVSESNLNRQYFNKSHINKNKADSCKDEIIKINPNCQIESIPKFLNLKDLNVLIPKVDYVVNAIDFDSTEFINCNTLSKENNKTEIFSINLGFGCCTIVFNQSSPDLLSFFKVSDPKELKIKLLDWVINNNSSEWFKEKYEIFKNSSVPYEPQIITGALLNSALVTKIITDLSLGKQVKTFPEIYYLEL